ESLRRSRDCLPSPERWLPPGQWAARFHQAPPEVRRPRVEADNAPVRETLSDAARTLAAPSRTACLGPTRYRDTFLEPLPLGRIDGERDTATVQPFLRPPNVDRRAARPRVAEH